ncbi:MAG: MATE family efflux transporter, partial [Actinomycetia bacterium]|nr:MATE family efflux transporter [Actinomycetes bacterium]
MKSQKDQILNGDLRVLLFRFSIPSIVGMIVSALYNLVDTIFVGNGVGPIAIAALTIVFPIQIIMLAIGLMIGVGSASVISRGLGKGDEGLAAKTVGNAVIVNIILNAFLMSAALIFIDNILKFFGASANVMPYACDYLSIILIGFIFFSLSFAANHIIRAEGRPRAAIYPMIIGAALNIILDPIFIFVFKMGVRGAAIATIISQAASVLYIVLYLYFGKSIFRPKKGMFRIDFRLIKNILTIGFPSFLTAITDSIIFLIFNRAILYYGNDTYLAIAGITIRIMNFIVMPIVGISYGFSTIVSFNYGAKLYIRVKKVFREAVIWTSLLAFIGFIMSMFFPRLLFRIFTDDIQVINNGIVPMRIAVILFPVLGFLIVGGTLFQAIGKPVPALIINFSRQVIFLLPAIFILPIFFGLNGVFLSWPVSDFLSFIVTIIFIV